MKRIFLLTMTVLLSVGIMVAQAPQKKQHHPKGGDKLEQLKSDLNLSDDQVEQLKDVFEKYKPKMHEVKANESYSDDERREAMKELHAARKEEVKGILTEEQFEKFLAMREQHRENGPKGHHKPMGNPNGGNPNGSK